MYQALDFDHGITLPGKLKETEPIAPIFWVPPYATGSLHMSIHEILPLPCGPCIILSQR